MALALIQSMTSALTTLVITPTATAWPMFKRELHPGLLAECLQLTARGSHRLWLGNEGSRLGSLLRHEGPKLGLKGVDDGRRAADEDLLGHGSPPSMDECDVQKINRRLRIP